MKVENVETISNKLLLDEIFVYYRASLKFRAIQLFSKFTK